MIDLWFRVLLGHLVGDYVLQNNWMAVNKKKQWIPCLMHCLLWTVSIMIAILPELLVTTWLMVFGLLYASHLILDKTGLVEWWCKVTKSRTFAAAKTYADSVEPPFFAKLITVSYTAIVQTVIDNTFHLLLVTGILVWIFGV